MPPKQIKQAKNSQPQPKINEKPAQKTLDRGAQKPIAPAKDHSQQRPQDDQAETSPKQNTALPAEPKQIRRIAQRSQMPTDKGELIQYLSERIKQAEDALNDTEQLLEEQVKEREKIAKALDERNDQLSKLYQVDQRALPDKIKEKLNEILTTTVTQKIEAEENLQEEKLKNYEYKTIYEELKWEDKNNKIRLDEQEKKQNLLIAQLEKLNQVNKDHEEEIAALEKQYAQITQQKQALEDKYLQMRVAMERMGDIKGVLNRFFGNEDLFDQKMELRQQKVQRLPQPAKDVALPPSRQSRSAKPSNNAVKLKPLAKPKNDDEDFWKADFKPKNQAY